MGKDLDTERSYHRWFHGPNGKGGNNEGSMGKGVCIRNRYWSFGT